VTTFILIILVTVGFPTAVMLAFTWFITAAFDETSVLRRGCSRLEEAWIMRRVTA
jgi:hypothetical protein